jgi:DNA (cytosine-5)-methyltransferase 1
MFSGIGGFELAIVTNLNNKPTLSSSPIRTIQFIEIDRNAQSVLRFHFPDIPIHSDIRTYEPKESGGLYTIGFPCTGTSLAGKRTGLKHEASGLWYEALRCIKSGSPDFIIIENPIGLINNGLRECLDGLRMAGYHFEPPQVISIDTLGGPQKRARLFVIAYPNNFVQSFQGTTSWNEQIRTSLTSAEGTKTESRRLSMDDGIPQVLGGKCVDKEWGELPTWVIPARTPKRREAISLYAKSVAPQQAAIAIKRIQYLWQWLHA